jgi:hypothetical protein
LVLAYPISSVHSSRNETHHGSHATSLLSRERSPSLPCILSPSLYIHSYYLTLLRYLQERRVLGRLPSLRSSNRLSHHCCVSICILQVYKDHKLSCNLISYTKLHSDSTQVHQVRLSVHNKSPATQSPSATITLLAQGLWRYRLQDPRLRCHKQKDRSSTKRQLRRHSAHNRMPRKH